MIHPKYLIELNRNIEIAVKTAKRYIDFISFVIYVVYILFNFERDTYSIRFYRTI